MAFGLLYDFLMGQSIDSYKYFGAHFVKQDGVDGVVFRVYAPLAREVSVIGEFNDWNPYNHVMKKVDEAGVFEIFISGLKNYQSYKYHILNCNGVYVDKQDPYGYYCEYRPGSCTRLFDVENFIWHDESYLKSRNRNFDKPMSIYELHIGSWLGRDGERYLSFEEVVDKLIEYILANGYTHVELMPITQYPFDGSWGYQATGFYAVDSRYGNPYQLMSFIDRLHQKGIGVILDYVVVHFATDPYSLEKFDGSNLYEYQGENEYSQWGSKLFDLGKDPVRSFLMSSMNYFLTYFHFDGLRLDAISNVIYWHGNTDKGENAGAIEFIKRLNGKLHQVHPDIMMIAEDSSAYKGVTKPLEYGGLGFDHKWDLGWMNDTLKYFGKDPIYRKYFHDEVVHGKGTIINKMWGNYEQKFAQLRNLYTYMWAHPGKKLNFMGNELATFDEWNEMKSLPWSLRTFPKHDSVLRMVRDLNLIYQSEKAMHFEEHNPAKFQWLMADNASQSIYAFRRIYEDESLVFIFNMTPNYYEYINIGVPLEGEYIELFNSDKDVYGGYNQYNGLPLKTMNMMWNNQPYTISIKLASFGALILKHKIAKKEIEEVKVEKEVVVKKTKRVYKKRTNKVKK